MNDWDDDDLYESRLRGLAESAFWPVTMIVGGIVWYFAIYGAVHFVRSLLVSL